MEIGSSELLLIFLVIIIFFGANKIPELAKGLGKGIRQFKDATSGIQREIERSIEEKPEVRKSEPLKVNEPEKSVAQKTEGASTIVSDEAEKSVVQKPEEASPIVSPEEEPHIVSGEKQETKPETDTR